MSDEQQEVTKEELEETNGEPLPDRELMSTITPTPGEDIITPTPGEDEWSIPREPPGT
jgi:hypothetical protein